MDRVDEDLKNVCENEGFVSSRLIYEPLGRLVRALYSDPEKISRLCVAFNQLSPIGQLRALYLIRLIQLRKPKAECEKILLTHLNTYSAESIKSKIVKPIGFFHLDNNESGTSADPIAKTLGLVKGVDLGKIRQLLAGKNA